MKKLVSFGCALLVSSLLTGCMSGPMRLTRTWDDWTNQKYTENTWLHGALLQDVLPVYPIVRFVMAIGDVLVVNPYYFWGRDAWDNRGTGYVHDQPEAQKTVTGYSGPTMPNPGGPK